MAISSKPDALVLYNPVIDNGPGGYKHSEVQAYWEGFSPMNNIDASSPPTVFFLGTNDSTIPVTTAETYRGLMETAGRRCDLHLYQDEPHSFFNFDVIGDSSGPFYGYQATVFKTDEFLVSLGYLSDPHEAPTPATGWVTIFGDAGFSGGSEATASPVMTDAAADSIAANIDPVNLTDGEFIRVTGSVTVNAPLSGGAFRVGLYDGDDPVTAGDGTGYVGIWSEAPATSNTKIAAGDGMGSSHPFETAFADELSLVPAASATVPAGTPVDFTLMISRNGSNLDISTGFTDGAAYRPSQNLLNVPVANFSYGSVVFLLTGNLNGTQASFSNIEITSGPVLPTPDPPANPSGLITYVDAVDGGAGNTFATGGSLGGTSWVGPNSSGSNATQWNKRTSVEGFDGALYQASSSSTSPPELTTQITGLADGSYRIWAFYWDQVDSNSQNWVLSAGLTSGSLTTYSSPGEPAVSGATSGGVTNAASLSFTTPVSTVAGNGLRNLFGVDLGVVEVTGGAVVNVFLGNNLTNGTNNRAWYDGVGYQAATPPLSIGARLLGVDFNRNDAFGAPSQSSFRIVSGSATQGQNASSYSKTIGTHQVTISQPDSTLFEFRGANTDSSRAIPGGDTSRSFLVSDFIATREGAMDLEISGLAAGDYVFRSFHLDPITGSALGFAQGTTTTSANSIEARIGGQVMDAVQPTALGSAGLNTTFIGDGQLPMIEFSLTHDGLSPLVVELRSTQSNGTANFLLLNGFELFQSNP